MDEVCLLYSCDAWHSWESHNMIGAFTPRGALDKYLDAMKKDGKLDADDMSNLQSINQTQGKDTNYNILTETLNPKYEKQR